MIEGSDSETKFNTIPYQSWSELLKVSEIDIVIICTYHNTLATIAKKALKNNSKLKDEAIKSGLISEKEYNNIVDPKKLTKPNF